MSVNLACQSRHFLGFCRQLMLTVFLVMSLINLALAQQPQGLILVSDAGRDVDDELTLLLTKALINQGLVDLRAVITNSKPTLKRAQLVLGTLNALGEFSVPVAMGEPINNDSITMDYEFNAPYLSGEQNFPDGQSLLLQTFEQAADHSLLLVLISGMTDANQFMMQHPELAKRKIDKVMIMGGVLSDKNGFVHDEQGRLIPDESYNNHIDRDAARSLYAFLQDKKIPLVVVSRYAAMASYLTPQFYDRLANKGHIVGTHLATKASQSIQHLWRRTFLAADDPAREGLPPYCDKAWFLKTFTNNDAVLYDLGPQDIIWPYVTKLNAYDPLTLFAAIRPDLFDPEIDHTVSVIGVSPNKPGMKQPEEVRSQLIEWLYQYE